MLMGDSFEDFILDVAIKKNNLRAPNAPNNADTFFTLSLFLCSTKSPTPLHINVVENYCLHIFHIARFIEAGAAFSYFAAYQIVANLWNFCFARVIRAPARVVLWNEAHGNQSQFT